MRLIIVSAPPLPMVPRVCAAGRVPRLATYTRCAAWSCAGGPAGGHEVLPVALAEAGPSLCTRAYQAVAIAAAGRQRGAEVLYIPCPWCLLRWVGGVVLRRPVHVPPRVLSEGYDDDN